jgi:hypothetical protein
MESGEFPLHPSPFPRRHSLGRSNFTQRLRLLALPVVVTLTLVGAGTQVAGVSADSNKTNAKSIVQMKLAQKGIATSSGGGVAATGPAIAFNIEAVPQINVQVVAGGPQTEAVSTQNATNNLTGTQTTAAISGDSNANGGVATSGPAIAGSIVVGAQINVQVIACMNATGPIDQTASNDANVDQMTGAASGDATANGAGSDAHSGAAAAISVAVVRQRNVQVYRCQNGGGGTSSQMAANIAAAAQMAAGVSGNANASGGGSATTGKAKAGSVSKSNQSNSQHAADD